MEKQELEKILTEVDWSGLENKITQMINIPVKLKTEIKEAREFYIAVESQELANSAGVLATAMSSLKIKNSGILFTDDQKMLIISLDYRWEYRSGGSNGCDFLRTGYNFKTREWILG